MQYLESTERERDPREVVRSRCRDIMLHLLKDGAYKDIAEEHIHYQEYMILETCVLADL